MNWIWFVGQQMIRMATEQNNCSGSTTTTRQSTTTSRSNGNQYYTYYDTTTYGHANPLPFMWRPASSTGGGGRCAARSMQCQRQHLPSDRHEDTLTTWRLAPSPHEYVACIIVFCNELAIDFSTRMRGGWLIMGIMWIRELVKVGDWGIKFSWRGISN